ncbi:MAG: lysophospholipid acyltransferase family protein [Acidimicrobiia bacterium]
MPDIPLLAPTMVERVLRLPNHVIGSTLFDLEVSGKHFVPQDGPVIFAANHFSHLDVPILAANVDRYIRFLAVDQLYGTSRSFDAALKFFAAIPLDRDGYPVAAMRTAIEHLTEGNALGLFPEGRRVESWGVDDPKRGAAWLAWMTGAPLIPVAIHGTQNSLAPGVQAFRRTAIRMWIEPPMDWTDYVDCEDPIGTMMSDWYTAVDNRLAPWRIEAQ